MKEAILVLTVCLNASMASAFALGTGVERRNYFQIAQEIKKFDVCVPRL